MEEYTFWDDEGQGVLYGITNGKITKRKYVLSARKALELAVESYMYDHFVSKEDGMKSVVFYLQKAQPPIFITPTLIDYFKAIKLPKYDDSDLCFLLQFPERKRCDTCSSNGSIMCFRPCGHSYCEKCITSFVECEKCHTTPERIFKIEKAKWKREIILGEAQIIYDKIF